METLRMFGRNKLGIVGLVLVALIVFGSLFGPSIRPVADEASMADVESVEILEQTPERQVSRWASIIKEFGRRINWVEEDHWDDEGKTCRWQQTEGDFDKYEGTWEFESADGGTLAKLQIEPIGLRSVYERHHPATNGDE